MENGELRDGIISTKSVSYTHLDVYKRQAVFLNRHNISPSVDQSADETVDFSTAGEKFFDSSIVQENRKKEKILLHFMQKKKQQLSLLLRCRR